MPLSMNVEIIGTMAVTVNPPAKQAMNMSTTNDGLAVIEAPPTDEGDQVIRHDFLSLVERGYTRPGEVNPAELFDGVSCPDILSRCRTLNEMCGWGFDKDDFANAEMMMPDKDWPRTGLEVPVLTPFLDSPAQTFIELWRVAAAAQGNAGREAGPVMSWRWPGIKSVRLAHAASHVRSLEWRMVDLGANCGSLPGSPRIAGPAHAEVLAAAFQYPAWARAMGTENIPGVWLPGYRVSVMGYNENLVLTRSPQMTWNPWMDRLELDAQWSDHKGLKGLAVPTSKPFTRLALGTGEG